MNGFYLGRNYTASQRQLISNEHRKMCLELLAPTFISYFVFPIFIYFDFRGILPEPMLSTWLGAHMVLNIARMYLVYVWYPKSKRSNRHQIFDVTFLLIAFVSCLIWQILMPFADVEQYTFETMFFYIVIYGLVSGAMGIGAYWPLYYLVGNVTLLSGYFFQVIFLYDEPRYALAFGVVLYGIFLVQICFAFNRKSASLIVLQRKNETLAKRFEAQQIETQKIADSRKSLLAATSHDLRQPLQAMHLFLASMLSKPKPDPMLNQLKNSADGMNELLDRVLDLSKLESDTLEVHKTAFPIAHVLDKLSELYCIQATEKGLAFDTQASDAWVYTDVVLLERILSNVVSNAIKYTAEGGVRIRVAPSKNNTLNLSVVDTGIGLSEADQAVVFEEFTQLDNPERDRKKGLGLGLSIVKRLCALLDIHLTMESSVGQGTNMTFSLPIFYGTDFLQPKRSTDEALTSLQGRLIVVVDDDHDILQALEALLRSWGADVVAGESAEHVIDAVQQRGHCPDLLISDFRLRDGKTGLEAISQLRALWPDSDMDAFLLSGDTDPDLLMQVKAQGVHMLHKPIKPAQLRAQVQRILKPAL